MWGGGRRVPILEAAMEARNRVGVGIGLPYRPARDGIFELLRSPVPDVSHKFEGR